ncbi:MAG: hypothetical protein SV775_07215 [Thermodesulfobacteriota bacterium]|nr:hypothetical protein [Thermodesulfobacteriota bacterium]
MIKSNTLVERRSTDFCDGATAMKYNINILKQVFQESREVAGAYLFGSQ